MQWLTCLFAASLLSSSAMIAAAQGPPTTPPNVPALVAAIKAKQATKVDELIGPLVGATPDKFPTPQVVAAIKTAAGAAGAEEGDVNAEVVGTLATVLGDRFDVEPSAVVPELIDALKGTQSNEAGEALDRLFSYKTNHKITATDEGWDVRANAWRALWGRIGKMPPPTMWMAGFKAAGLALPTPDPATFCGELLKGLEHGEVHIRQNSYLILNELLAPKNFEFDARAQQKDRQSTVNDMRTYYEAKKSEVIKNAKMMIEGLG